MLKLIPKALGSTTNGNDGSNFLPLPFNDDAAKFLHFLEVELLTKENYDSAPNVDAFSNYTITMDGKWLLLT